MSCYAHSPKLYAGSIEFYDIDRNISIDSNSFFPLNNPEYYYAGFPVPIPGEHIIGMDVYNNEDNVDFVVVSRTFYPKGREKGYCHIKYNIKRYKEDVKEDL